MSAAKEGIPMQKPIKQPEKANPSQNSWPRLQAVGYSVSENNWKMTQTPARLELRRKKGGTTNRNRLQLWTARGIVLVSSALIIVSMGSLISPQTAIAQTAKKTKLTRPSDAIIGEWWTEGREGRIRFKRYKDGTFIGVTTCCNPKNPSKDNPGNLDIHNPDPKKRSRSNIGIVLIWNLKYDEDGEYTDGYVYNPRDGKTYRMNIEVIDRNTLEIRGYIGIPLLGQTQTWKRAGK